MGSKDVKEEERQALADLLRVSRRYLIESGRTLIEVFPDGTAGEDDEEEEEEAA